MADQKAGQVTETGNQAEAGQPVVESVLGFESFTRADYLDLVLAALAFMFLIGSLIGFFEIRSRAKRVAADVAKEEARIQVRELVMGMLPQLVAPQVRFEVENQLADAEANRIAQSFGDDDGG